MSNDPNETWWIKLAPRENPAEPGQGSTEPVIYQLAAGPGATRCTASRLEIDKRSVIQRLAVDLPRRGLVTLRYQPRWKRLGKPAAKTAGSAAGVAWGAARAIARLRQPPPPPQHKSRESAKELAEKGSLVFSLYNLQKNGRDVIDVWQQPPAGYYDGAGTLVIEGTIRQGDLAPGWDAA